MVVMKMSSLLGTVDCDVEKGGSLVVVVLSWVADGSMLSGCVS